MKRIFSAGGIVLKKVDGEVKVLLTQHSKHKGWEFPKGHIEIGETAQIAAIREVEEEAGVRAEVLEKVGELEYFYFESGERVLKKVTYFVMKYYGDGEATTADEVMDQGWFKVTEVESKLTFKSAKEFWLKVSAKVEEIASKI